MKFLMFAVCAGFVLFASATTSGADPPIREVLPAPADVQVDLCDTSVLFHSDGTTIRRSFTDELGRTVRLLETYPGFRTTLTNLDTGASLTATTTGPLHQRVNPDGSTTFTGTGGWAWGGLHPGTLAPGLFLLHGHITLHLDAAGNLTSSSFHGRTIDVCAVIAS